MSKPRRDRTWARSRTTRHAWLLDSREPGAQPREVLILRWRKKETMNGTRWAAFVVYPVEIEGDPEPAIIQRWVPAETLRPARTDPNRAFGLR